MDINGSLYNVELLWNRPRPFLQYVWQRIFQLFGEDEFNMGFYGMFLIPNAFFWIICVLFLIPDLTGKPKFILQYKIQNYKTDVPISYTDLWKAVKVALYNQIVVGLPVTYVTFYLMKWRGCSYGVDLPTLLTFLMQLLTLLAVEEAGFYYSHRLLHHPQIYKYIHKVHHEYTAPFSVASIYAHPVEHLVANLAPPIIGILITKVHVFVALLWVIAVYNGAIFGHCGYHFPLQRSAEAHDFHHLKFNYNFGPFGILDSLHGTNRGFKGTVQSKRDFISMSLTPVKLRIPEKASTRRGRTKKAD